MAKKLIITEQQALRLQEMLQKKTIKENPNLKDIYNNTLAGMKSGGSTQTNTKVNSSTPNSSIPNSFSQTPTKVNSTPNNSQQKIVANNTGAKIEKTFIPNHTGKIYMSQLIDDAVSNVYLFKIIYNEGSDTAVLTLNSDKSITNTNGEVRQYDIFNDVEYFPNFVDVEKTDGSGFRVTQVGQMQLNDDQWVVTKPIKLALGFRSNINESKEINPKKKVYKLTETQLNMLKSKGMLKEDDDPCWDGYKQYGTKDKDGKEVPNCVPINEEESFLDSLPKSKSDEMIIDTDEKFVLTIKKDPVNFDLIERIKNLIDEHNDWYEKEADSRLASEKDEQHFNPMFENKK